MFEWLGNYDWYNSFLRHTVESSRRSLTARDSSIRPVKLVVYKKFTNQHDPKPMWKTPGLDYLLGALICHAQVKTLPFYHFV